MAFSRAARPRLQKLTPSCLSHLRALSRQSPLLHLSQPRRRPKLPYLAIPSLAPRVVSESLARRLASTNNFRQTARNITEISIYSVFFTAVAAGFLAWLGHEALGHEFPAPDSWSWRTVLLWHAARAYEDPDMSDNGSAQLILALETYNRVLKNLEGREQDGDGIEEIEALRYPDLDVEVTKPSNVAEIYDVTGKDEDWRRAYVDVLMSIARILEQLDGWVEDLETGVIAPPAYITGPSYSDPKPWPRNAPKTPPREGHIRPLAFSSELMYRKVKATVENNVAKDPNSFAANQYLDACLSLATSIANKNSLAKADQADALKAIQDGVDFVSRTTVPRWKLSTVFKASSKSTLSNVVEIPPCTNRERLLRGLAFYRLRFEDMNAALPVFLLAAQDYMNQSQLSAPRSLIKPILQPGASLEPLTADNNSAQRIIRALFHRIVDLYRTIQYPPALPNGNSPLSSEDALRDCAEAAAVIEAAEVMFATSPSKHELSRHWTRSALAMAHFRSIGAQDEPSQASQANIAATAQHDLTIDERLKCAQCANVALRNWSKMVEYMKSEAKLNSSTESEAMQAWLNESKEQYGWVKKVERADATTKLKLEQWKMYTMMPTWVLQLTVAFL